MLDAQLAVNPSVIIFNSSFLFPPFALFHLVIASITSNLDFCPLSWLTTCIDTVIALWRPSNIPTKRDERLIHRDPISTRADNLPPLVLFIHSLPSRQRDPRILSFAEARNSRSLDSRQHRTHGRIVRTNVWHRRDSFINSVWWKGRERGRAIKAVQRRKKIVVFSVPRDAQHTGALQICAQSAQTFQRTWRIAKINGAMTKLCVRLYKASITATSKAEMSIICGSFYAVIFHKFLWKCINGAFPIARYVWISSEIWDESKKRAK